MNYIEQDCPLCGRPSKYCLAYHDSIKYFRCTYCTDFQLTDNAEGLVASATEGWRNDVSKASHESDTDQILVVEMVEVSNLKPGEHQYPVWRFRDRAKIQQCI